MDALEAQNVARWDRVVHALDQELENGAREDGDRGGRAKAIRWRQQKGAGRKYPPCAPAPPSY